MRNSSFPPGYRFRPTDVELLVYYLKRKVMGKKLHFNIISEVDIYKYEPSDLPDKSCLRHGDLKWYFFCPRGRKYGTGERTNRATDKGYWKTTGRDRPVQYRDKVVGMIRTLVYHTGKAPRGDRTDWVMHEYRLQDRDLADPGTLDSFVLCVIFHKDGPGPRNGAQYGAPFIEEEWTDEEEDNCLSSVPSANFCTPTSINSVNSIASTSNDPVSLYGGSSSEVYSFEAAPSAYKALSPVPENDAMLTNDLDVQLAQCPDDDVHSMLAFFIEDDNTILNEATTENLGELNCEANAAARTYPDEYDIYNDLGDIELNDVYNLQNGYAAGYAFNEMLPSDNVSFLELDDLDTPLVPVEVVSAGSRRADCIYTDPGNYEICEKACDTVDTSNVSLNLVGTNDSSPLQPAGPPGSSSSQNNDAVGN